MSPPQMALTDEQKKDVLNVISRFETWSDIYVKPSEGLFSSMLERETFKQKVRTLKVKKIPADSDGSPVVEGLTTKDLAKLELKEEALDQVFSTFAGSTKTNYVEEFKVVAQLEKWKSDETFNVKAYETQVTYAVLGYIGGQILYYGLQAIAIYVLFLAPAVEYFFDIDILHPFK
eukprot:CAMPEP_0117875174 /NCGR_PEP_ID=MMETSP0950-20121206/12782_1 /TAXON_ID=44440 /ORGANISM="Chattonella subsalsa, Strain CCMP2191" /LENGTH=174 /DNA_ID=CAMNT_0005728609 /DNA_START=193 /DNA_END=717 /DNA_ORIENTATION=-